MLEFGAIVALLVQNLVGMVLRIIFSFKNFKLDTLMWKNIGMPKPCKNVLVHHIFILKF